MSIILILISILLGLLAYWVTGMLTPDRRIAVVVGVIVFLLVLVGAIPVRV